MTDSLWEKFCQLFELDHLWADESLRQNNERVLARERLMPEIRELMRQHTRAELIEKLEGTGLPFAPVGRPEEMFEDPHLVASDGLEEVTLPGGGKARLPSLPLEMGGRRFARAAALSEAGESSRSILASLGYPADAIERFLAGGAVEDAET